MSGLPLIDFNNLDDLNEVDKSLVTCKACNLVMNNPAKCSLCSNHMCSEEFKNGIEAGKCPVCQKSITRNNMRKPTPEVVAAHAALIRQCPFDPAHRGLISEMRGHELGCASNPAHQASRGASQSPEGIAQATARSRGIRPA